MSGSAADADARIQPGLALLRSPGVRGRVAVDLAEVLVGAVGAVDVRMPHRRVAGVTVEDVDQQASRSRDGCIDIDAVPV